MTRTYVSWLWSLIQLWITFFNTCFLQSTYLKLVFICIKLKFFRTLCIQSKEQRLLNIVNSLYLKKNITIDITTLLLRGGARVKKGCLNVMKMSRLQLKNEKNRLTSISFKSNFRKKKKWICYKSNQIGKCIF